MLTVRVPAKLNLGLAVGALRADGYHPLQTIFQAVSVYDELTVQEQAGPFSLTITGLTSGVPTDGRNLILRAANLLAQHAGRAAEGVAFHLHKDIPVAGGMAGGSADAAAALLACATLWQLKIERSELIELAGQLGSDVAFPLLGQTMLGSSRGEILTPALARGELHWVLIGSASGMSTPEVFAEFDRLSADQLLLEPMISPELMQALGGGQPPIVARALKNDLEPAACSLRPELREVLDLGLAAGALATLLSGSGPTVALLAEDATHGTELAEKMRAAGYEYVRCAHGPVPGARVLPRNSGS